MRNYLVFVLLFTFLSCQSSDDEDASTVKLQEKALVSSVAGVTVSDFSGKIFERGIKLSWTLNSNDQQVMLRRSDQSAPASFNDGDLVYRGVSDFFEDVFAVTSSVYYYQLFIYSPEDGYLPVSELTLDLDTPSETTLLPVQDLSYLVSDRRVLLSWVAPDDIEVVQFEIVRNDQPVALVQRPFWVDRAPLYEQSAKYEVFSVNSVGVRSDQTMEFVVNIPRPIIDISDPLYIDAQNNHAQLNWLVPDDEYYLKTMIYRDGELIFEDTDSAGHFVDNQVLDRGIYTYSLAYVNTSLVSSPLHEVQIRVLDTLAPNTVTELLIDAQNNQSIISWGLPEDPDIDFVELFKGDVLIYSGNELSYVDTNVLDGDSINYIIRTVDMSGNISEHIELAVVVLDTQAPLNVTEFVVDAYNNQSFLSWVFLDDSDIDYIELFKGDVLIYSGNELSFVDTSVLDGELVNYKIRAVDMSGNFSEYIDADVMVIDTHAPLNVTEFLVDARNNQSNISWVLPIESDLHYVEILKNDVSIYAGLDEQFLDLDVSDGDNINYRIRAVDVSGNISLEAVMDVLVIDDIAPSAITEAKIDVYDSQLNISWENPLENYSKIEIFRGDGPIDFYGDGVLVHQEDFNSENTEYKALGLINDQFYYYGLYVVDDFNNVSQLYGLSSIPVVEGALDESLEGVGFAEFAPHDSMMEYLVDSQIDEQGRLLLLWQDYLMQPAGIRLERRLQNGQEDESFGEFGQVIYQDPINSGYPERLIQLDSGEIIVAGRQWNSVNYSVSLVKFSEDGVVDPDFGVSSAAGNLTVSEAATPGGIAITSSVANFNQLSGLEKHGDDVYVIGNATIGSDYIIFSMKVDAQSGELDTAYSSDPTDSSIAGISVYNTASMSFYNIETVINDLGQLYVSGITSSVGMLLRLTESGEVDASFNSGQAVSIVMDDQCLQLQSMDDLLLDDVNDIYMSVQCYDNQSYLFSKQLHKLNVNGDYVTDFGVQSDGIETLSIDSNSNPAFMAIDDQQQIWVATSQSAEVGNDLVLFKLSTAGVVQNNSGYLYQDVLGVGLYEYPKKLMLDPDTQRPIVLGSKYENGTEDLFIMKIITKSPDYQPSI